MDFYKQHIKIISEKRCFQKYKIYCDQARIQEISRKHSSGAVILCSSPKVDTSRGQR